MTIASGPLVLEAPNSVALSEAADTPDDDGCKLFCPDSDILAPAPVGNGLDEIGAIEENKEEEVVEVNGARVDEMVSEIDAEVLEDPTPP